MASIQGLLQKIASAASAGVASWFGTNGIKAQMDDVASLLLERSVQVVESTTTLALLSAADARIAIVNGVGIYAYRTSGTASDLDIPANGGGRWKWQSALGTSQYKEVIGNSTAGATSFTINHNLGTLFPTVLCFEPASPGGTSGYRLRDITAIASVTFIDENKTLVDFGATVPSTSQYTIVIKK